MEEVDVKTLQKKVDYFFKSKECVHVKFKRGFWKNGYVTEISADFFILDELIEGDMPVFFMEIKDVEKYNKKGVETA